jgi:hypothetical protein
MGPGEFLLNSSMPGTNFGWLSGLWRNVKTSSVGLLTTMVASKRFAIINSPSEDNNKETVNLAVQLSLEKIILLICEIGYNLSK